MISKVTLRKFKKFNHAEFVLKPQGLTLLAGGNNSGKSTLLHALAVWEFCREVWEQDRSRDKLNAGTTAKKILLRPDEFYPVSVPALNHLWHNVRPSPQGDDLSIAVEWQWTSPSAADAPAGTPASSPETHRLTFGLSHHHERIHLKLTDTSLRPGVPIPRLAFLPSFAGMREREPRMNPTERARLIGAGMPGATLRNILQDLYDKNVDGLKALLKSRPVDPKKRSEFIENDGWEQLQLVINDVFRGDKVGKISLQVRRYNELIHTALKVETVRAFLHKKKLKALLGVPPRDLMVEGAGFLQWLSVYALLVNPELDVVLLDEPDAHLHAQLQGYLLDRLQQHATRFRKQVLVATHSTVVLSHARVEAILRVEEQKYLADEGGRVRLFEGIGSVYCPMLDQLKRHKRLFFYEGPSDLALLQIWARTLGIAWPTNLVLRESTRVSHADRALVFGEFRKEIADLKGLSLQDRDDDPLGEVKQNLTFGSLSEFVKGFGLRKWRRRNIESYLLCARAIAQASGRTEAEVADVFTLNGVAVPPNHTAWDCPEALALCDGKRIVLHPENPNSVLARLGCTYKQIAAAMQPQEIPDDVKEFLKQLVEFAKP